MILNKKPSFLKFFTVLSFVLPLFCIALPAQARWATPLDVDTAIESFNRTIYVRKNGAYTETIEMLSVPLKESGKDKLVHHSLTYNASNATLKILEAKTIDEQGKEHKVNPKHIEDKPLASSPHGFDQMNQILIAFPNVSLKSKVYLKYEQTIQEPISPGFFSMDFAFGFEYLKSAEVHITSEIPLFMKKNDPELFLTLQQKQSEKLHYLDIVVQKPVLKFPIDENFAASNGHTMPWVTLSTVQTWPEFGNLFVKRYETVTHQPLPALFNQIATEANTETTLIDKINKVTMRLAENITYMGDWRTIKGGYIPRDLAEIAKTKIGDCKDFSASTTAILRKMGIPAHVALVYRGEELRSPNNLPTTMAFNHAFVRVQTPDQTLWIDPTNFSSFAQGLYPDIAEKRALVLDSTGPMLMETPSINEKESIVSLIKEIILPKTETDATTVSGRLTLKGRYTLDLIGADLQASKDVINRGIISSITDESRTLDWKIEPYKLDSRVVHDLNFQFTLTEKHSETKTTAGKALLLRSQNLIPKLLTKTKGRVSDLQFELPGTYIMEQLLPKVSLVGKDLSHCKVNSPWFDGSRTIKDTPAGIQVVEEYVVKKHKISNTELQSKAYAEFQTKIYSCFGDTALVYKH